MDKQEKVEISFDDLNLMMSQYDKSWGIKGDTDVESCFANVGQQMWLIFRADGFDIDFERKVVILKDWHVVDRCLFVCAMVDEAYEGLLSDTGVWNDVFGCNGDDDVDYNSSMPSMVFLGLTEHRHYRMNGGKLS